VHRADRCVHQLDGLRFGLVGLRFCILFRHREHALEELDVAVAAVGLFGPEAERHIRRRSAVVVHAAGGGVKRPPRDFRQHRQRQTGYGQIDFGFPFAGHHVIGLIISELDFKRAARFLGGFGCRSKILRRIRHIAQAVILSDLSDIQTVQANPALILSCIGRDRHGYTPSV